ncbi:MAG TPA: glycine cleavage T C-terminal barrel domain-containing protein [Verrucomicrobiae bacterium]|nr:glycine cleavage T C-terminal barrel domain-containing protein [Verrucomicrobiae bacterium]
MTRAGAGTAALYNDAMSNVPGPAEQYRAVREAAAVIDRSSVGKAEVEGRDRASFLQGMLSNDVKALAPGQGCAAAFLDAHGKVMALLRVYALSDRLLLELPAGLTQKTLLLLDKYLISEKAAFEPLDEAYAVLSVQGAQAPALIAGLAGAPMDLAPHAHVEATLAGIATRVVQRSEFGVRPGFFLWAAPDAMPALRAAVEGAGATPVEPAVGEVLRVEAGEPVYGQDVDESVILPETNLEHLVSYTKGCYIGQEVVARVKYRGHVNRALTGLTLEGDRVPTPGAPVFAGEREIGRVTSAVRSLGLGAPIALGYVRREHLEPGSAVAVRIEDILVPARVTPPPFI